MLEYLRIRNLALIDDLELEFADGLNVITGETGAGKSFILKALGFLTGDKLDAAMVRPGKERAVVEAIFRGLPAHVLRDDDAPDPERPSDTEDARPAPEETFLRRELSAATGRSRLTINDALGSQERAKALRPHLLVHASQHGQQKLLNPAYQAAILDSWVGDKTLIPARDAALREIRAVMAERDALERKCRELENRRELLEFQRQEIEKVAPQPGEEDSLEARRRAVKDHAAVQDAIQDALAALRHAEGGLVEGVDDLAKALDVLNRASAEPQEFAAEAERLTEAREFFVDMESALRKAARRETEEADLEAIEARLFQLAQLKRKLKRSLDEIVDLEREIDEAISFLDACGLDRAQLLKAQRRAAATLLEILERLAAARREAAGELCRSLEQELAGLGFSDKVKVEVEFTPHPLFPEAYAAAQAQDSRDAAINTTDSSTEVFENSNDTKNHANRAKRPTRPDHATQPPDRPDDEALLARLVDERARFLWRPNPGQPAQPLDRIASGGELSRFLLALTSLTARNEHAALIFDEVDAGVGGRTLTFLGERIQDLARRQQVLLITHWPQLAALAEKHFLVEKHFEGDETYTRCRPLDAHAMEAELKRMAGEEAPTSGPLLKPF